MARRLAAGLRQDVPGLIVSDERPTIVDGAWTLAATLPSDIDARRFLAGTVAECVPWLPDGGRVRVPFGTGYSDEEQEQLVLVAAKVIYYLREPRESCDAQETGATDSLAPEAVLDPS